MTRGHPVNCKRVLTEFPTAGRQPACQEACPTGALDDGRLDARKCLAWLVQAPGDFPREHRQALGDRLYGCDECTVVCPPSRLASRRLGDLPHGERPGPTVDVLRRRVRRCHRSGARALPR